MTLSIAPTQLFWVGVRDMLRNTAPSGLHLYDHGRDIPDKPGYPYGVIFAIGGQEPTGPPMADREADIEQHIQLDSIGRWADQALFLADAFRAAVLNRANAVPVAGWVLHHRRTLSGVGEIDREGQPGGRQLFCNHSQYALHWTPA